LVRVIHWNRETDEFTPGQWFRGKIYADRSDISPDGQHMIYFAMGGVAWAIPETGGTWTALSRVPSLTALAIWPQGDTWAGGGIFKSNKSYWLDTYHSSLRDHTNLRRIFLHPAPSRMERDGWVPKEQRLRMFEKEIPDGWTLRLKRNYPTVRYELEHREHGVKLEFPAWEWAEWDRHRLVWAEQGCIRAARLEPHRLEAACTLYDANNQQLTTNNQQPATNN
jgi:hypothetical protein